MHADPLCARISKEQVDGVIHAFYSKLRSHPELSGYFAHVQDFSAHERHIAVFWWWAMGGRAERERPFDMSGRHAALNLNERAFGLWLELFRETLLENLPRDVAEEWYALAGKIGANLRAMLLGGAMARNSSDR